MELPLGSNPMRFYTRARDPADSSYGYSSIDCIMLGDIPLDALTEEQWSALARWVKSAENW